MTTQDERSTSSGTIGAVSQALVAGKPIGSPHGAIVSGRYPLAPSAALALRSPEEVDQSLQAHLQRISGQPLAFKSRLVFPEGRSMVRITTGLSWNCPSSALDECRTAAAASLRAAPEEEIAKAVYRLRIVTRGREQRSDADREAEAVIWIEQLRCWPGDIVLDVLKGWPHRQDGQWWPTWHDVEAELRAKTSLRQIIVSHLKNPPLAIEAPPQQTPEERKAVAEKFAKLSEDLGKPEPVSVSQRDLSQAEKADLVQSLIAERDQPLTISHRFHTLLQQQISEEEEARQNRAHSASQNNP